MSKHFRATRAIAALLAMILIVSCSKEDSGSGIVNPETVSKPDQVFYGLTASNGLVRYNANASTTAQATIAITGLPAGERILAIDVRPATGQLYGLGSSNRLFVINHETGAAIAVGAGSFTPAISGTIAGFDFNPTVDRIRLVTSTGQNLRLHPETGLVAAVDVSLTAGPSVAAAAYTNSYAGAVSTVLYDIDINTGKLYRQDPPNNGVLVEIGSLETAGSGEGGFDISPDNKTALAVLNVGSGSSLFQINLTTGKATALGNLSTNIVGIAIPVPPVGYAADINGNLQIINLSAPATPAVRTISGLQPGEVVLGLDMRPATGQLYALGSSSRLYTINMASGAATAVSLAPFSTLLSGTSFGFDFNPTVDRIRLVSNTGQNLRLHPVTGDIAAVDGSLNPGAPAVSAAAYTNNFSGATTTTLFVIDPMTDKLYTQVPPNNGTLVETGSLGIDITAENGFDIGGTSNRAWAIVTTSAGTKLFSINTTTGAATESGSLPLGTRAFAVGLGF